MFQSLRQKLFQKPMTLHTDEIPAPAPAPEHTPPATAPDAGSIEPSLADACMSGWFRQETNELLEGFPILAADTVLDVGCGNGGFVRFCAQCGPDVIFTDIDEAKVAAVGALLAGTSARSLRPVVSDSNPLPIEDATASKIICMEVLEHVDDPNQVMRELVRVGQPGALYLLTVPDPASETVLKKVAPSIFFEKPNHVRVFGREAFEQLVLDAGLVIERRTFYGFYWSIWWMMFCACEQDFSPPWHPLLQNWTRTWETLLAMEKGAEIKKALDEFMPKSQAIIARKPL